MLMHGRMHQVNRSNLFHRRCGHRNRTRLAHRWRALGANCYFRYGLHAADSLLDFSASNSKIMCVHMKGTFLVKTMQHKNFDVAINY